MATAINQLKKKAKRANLKVFRGYKAIYQQVKNISADQQKILFIVGCQRSGTTLMTRIFIRDIEARVFGEFSPISDQDPNKLRLNPLDQVDEKFRRENAGLLVTKPLVESHRVRELLDYFKNSRAIWMFRHYKDVALSNLNRFGKENGVSDLEPIAHNESGNWRTAGISPVTQQQIARVYRPDMDPMEAAAWFWWVRNRIFIEQRLFEDPRIMMVKYEDLVQHPAQVMERIYNFTSYRYPGNKILSEVTDSSVGKAKNKELPTGVAEKCEAMLQNLNRHYTQQTN